MKYFFAFLIPLLVIAASIAGLARRPRHVPSRGAVAERVRPWSRAAIARRAQTSEAGHVDEVLRWWSGPVAKGDLLVRLSVPVSTPELRQGRQAVHRAEAAYQQHPSALHARQLAQARAELAAVPRFVRNGYVVAPVSGWLRGTQVVNGQYLPRAGTVGLIEVPARAKPTLVLAATEAARE